MSGSDYHGFINRMSILSRVVCDSDLVSSLVSFLVSALHGGKEAPVSSMYGSYTYPQCLKFS